MLIVFGVQIAQSVTSATGGPFDQVDQGLSANWDTSNDGSAASPSTSSVALVDTAGLKEYQTFMGDPSNDATCLCSDLDNSGDGGTHYYAALVAAPPTTVNQVSFMTGLATIPNVAITG